MEMDGLGCPVPILPQTRRSCLAKLTGQTGLSNIIWVCKHIVCVLQPQDRPLGYPCGVTVWLPTYSL
jgi:hypothetical protein